MSRRLLRQATALRGNVLTLPMLARHEPAPCLPMRGCHLLVRWTGDLSPLPEFGEVGPRRPIVVGWAAEEAVTIDTWAGIGHVPDVVYRYAVAAVSPGGVVGPLNPWTVESVVCDAEGAPYGLMPNAPQAISPSSLGRRPLVRWAYTTRSQQAPPDDFAVYATTPGTLFDWAHPTAVVAALGGQSHYVWRGNVQTPGATLLVTVRARSEDGVLSLIPQAGVGTSPSYVTLAEARAPMLVIPAGLPAIAEVRAEVTR